jgi:hypothetical protein
MLPYRICHPALKVQIPTHKESLGAQFGSLACEFGDYSAFLVL